MPHPSPHRLHIQAARDQQRCEVVRQWKFVTFVAGERHRPVPGDPAGRHADRRTRIGHRPHSRRPSRAAPLHRIQVICHELVFAVIAITPVFAVPTSRFELYYDVSCALRAGRAGVHTDRASADPREQHGTRPNLPVDRSGDSARRPASRRSRTTSPACPRRAAYHCHALPTLFSLRQSQSSDAALSRSGSSVPARPRDLARSLTSVVDREAQQRIGGAPWPASRNATTADGARDIETPWAKNMHATSGEGWTRRLG